MTICLRLLKFQLYPKLPLIKGRTSASHTGLPKPHSNFLIEFLDGRNVSHDKTSSISALPLHSTNDFKNVIYTESQTEYQAVEPICNVVVKPLSLTSDDILYCNGLGCHSVLHLHEDDLKRDVIYRENFSVIILTDPPSETHPGSALCLTKSQKDLDSPAINLSLSNTDERRAPASPGNSPSKPSPEQLDKIYNNLCDRLPKFFTQTQDYTIFHNNVIFQNNIKGVTIKGVVPYMQYMSMVRFFGHLRFAYVKMDILKITKHPEDGTVRVRWRIKGVSGLKVLSNFWRFRLWHYKTVKEQEVTWYDGFSTFYVGGDGLIYQHICDKMMPDEQKEKSSRANLAAKLALFVAVIPRPSWDNVLGAMSLSIMRFLEGQIHYPTPVK